MKRSINGQGDSARRGSRRLGLPGWKRNQDKAAGLDSSRARIALFESLEGRTLLSATPSGWQAKPVAVPHFLSQAQTQSINPSGGEALLFES